MLWRTSWYCEDFLGKCLGQILPRSPRNPILSQIFTNWAKVQALFLAILLELLSAFFPRYKRQFPINVSPILPFSRWQLELSPELEAILGKWWKRKFDLKTASLWSFSLFVRNHWRYKKTVSEIDRLYIFQWQGSVTNFYSTALFFFCHKIFSLKIEVFLLIFLKVATYFLRKCTKRRRPIFFLPQVGPTILRVCRAYSIYHRLILISYAKGRSN